MRSCVYAVQSGKQKKGVKVWPSDLLSVYSPDAPTVAPPSRGLMPRCGRVGAWLA